MPRFASNLSMMYTEHAFVDRFAAAAANGFRAVEYLFPYAFAREQLAQRLAEHGLRQAPFNAPPCDWDAGELNCSCLFDLIDEHGYKGHIGCEYRPRSGTRAELGWFQRYKDTQP